MSGRDQPEQKFILKKNMERLTWELERVETELWKLPPDPVLEKIGALLSGEIQEWNGSPTELVLVLELDMKPNLLTKHLNVNKARLLNDHQIDYAPVRTHAGRRIHLNRVLEERDDGVGGDDDLDSGGGV